MGGSESKKPDSPNVHGIDNAFTAKGHGSEIKGEIAVLNVGYAAGNPNHRSDDKNPPQGISGARNAFNAKSGGKAHFRGGTFNIGAHAGGGQARANKPGGPKGSG